MSSDVVSAQPRWAVARWLSPGHHRAMLALGMVLITLAALTVVQAVDAWRPAQAVRVTAVLPATAAEPIVASPTAAPAATKVVQAPGWLEPEPYPTVVTALTDGVLAQVKVLEGDPVKAGQVLATLVDQDAQLELAAAESAVAMAKARVAQAEARQRAAQADWDHPVERDRQVATAAAALREAQAELQQWPALVREAQARVLRWEDELARVQAAGAEGAATQREQFVARQEAQTSAASLQSMTAREAILQARVQRLEAEHIAAVRAAELRVEDRRLLEEARAHADDARAAAAQAQVAVDQARLRLQRMTIPAPSDGQVLRRIRMPGDRVTLSSDDPQSGQVLWLYDPRALQVRVDVPLADASAVLVGQACEVIVDVLPDQRFAGEVTRITHQADLQKNTLQCKVRLTDPHPMLRPDMLARVRFLASAAAQAQGDADRAVRVAETCLDGTRVWVVRQRRGLRGCAFPVEVQVLSREAGYATVTASLHPGDLLVQRPADLAAGELVRLLEAGGDA